MNARHLLIALLVGMAVVGGIDNYFYANNVNVPVWWVVSSTVALNILIFVWYYLDSNIRSFSRSKWLNIAVVGLAVVAIPYYIVRSREKSQRALALIKLVGFFALGIAFASLGQLAGAAVG